jgi:hypothetical protein
MTPAKLDKIRRMAADLRGDPATRTIAIEMLRRWEEQHPPSFTDVEEPEEDKPQNPPGMRNSEDYERHVFMSLHNWGRSQNGNLVHTFTYKKRAYRVVLFAHKKTQTYGWLRVDVARSEEVWSSKFSSMPAAHTDAWTCLNRI